MISPEKQSLLGVRKMPDRTFTFDPHEELVRAELAESVTLPIAKWTAFLTEFIDIAQSWVAADEMRQLYAGHLMDERESRRRVEAERDTLKEALEKAREDVVNLARAGFDSTRGRLAVESLTRIDAALAALSSSPEAEEEGT